MDGVKSQSTWLTMVAVTLVSGSDGIFSSLSSNRAEEAAALKLNQTEGLGSAPVWCDKRKRPCLYACYCFGYLSAWPGFIRVVYQIQAAITDLERRIYKLPFALL